MELKVCRATRLEGTITVPGDKSISHRALLLGSLACGETVIENFLRGKDCLATLRCLRQMGVKIEEEEDRVRVEGRGLGNLREPEEVLDAGNSGTTMRLLLGVLAGNPIFAVLTGDASLRRRPMDRVILPLKLMGAEIWGRQEGKLAPLAIRGQRELRPIEYTSPVASAQVKSAILLAGLYAEGETSVTEPALSRDHTERMLSYFGVPVKREGLTVRLRGRALLQGRPVRVPGDFSAAAFFLAAAAISPEGRVVVKEVGLNPTRTGLLEVLEAMGARLAVEVTGEWAGEPVGNVTVESSELRGVEIGGEIIPRLIDEIPVLTVVAACAAGKTVIRGAEELRYKESDRLATMALELGRLGAKVEVLPDGLIIHGGHPLQGSRVQSHGDHRVAMAMAVAGLVAEGETIIEGAEAIDVSFPNFPLLLATLAGEARGK
ncbi:3-phosphoshikimate 1-carboxyvinyltransferase [Ammonifex thiophilus]|uniref:3-phosphoshikimate 1-carboxyvinyltransferase n=1 Tax=Ammonifex thiophilus TaxID=444093 RepID=A0A3D8P2B4_9THEO|nr:3-phosphoshikimate 1-carboxyvinyltransferase [Ammonifex thiophilus]RDV80936.1 3-phosphoshikimate 1-carboxyvinyltransferase [Ammonifex thiophilus]